MRNSPITTSPRRLLIACAALASIGFASVTQADTLEKIKDSNSVRIGYANETPFAYTALDGSVTGESPEIVRKVFERMLTHPPAVAITGKGASARTVRQLAAGLAA